MWEQPRARAKGRRDAAPVTGSPSVSHRRAPEVAEQRNMPRRRSRRRGVDYDLKERLTGRTLQYLDVDYLASTGSSSVVANTSPYQNERRHKSTGGTRTSSSASVARNQLPHEVPWLFPQTSFYKERPLLTA